MELNIFFVIQGTIDLGLFYSKETTSTGLVGYTNAGYKSDPYKARFQTSYLFCYNGIAVSWRSTKQTLVATSINHFEIISLYEVGKECIWLRSVISHIQSICQKTPVNSSPTIIYEDNAACIAQVKRRYIKRDKIKHISSKFFYTHEL